VVAVVELVVQQVLLVVLVAVVLELILVLAAQGIHRIYLLLVAMGRLLLLFKVEMVVLEVSLVVVVEALEP
jgi:hypothetical protein